MVQPLADPEVTQSTKKSRYHLGKVFPLFWLVIASVKPLYSPEGKCYYARSEGIYSYTTGTTPPTPDQLEFLVSKCDQTQKSFQFLSWVRLEADVPDGSSRYFFRYHTAIKIDFRGYPGGEHRLILSKSNESPPELFQVPVGKSGKWMFVWLQVTETAVSLAVRSTMNYELEDHHNIFRKTFGKCQESHFFPSSSSQAQIF